MVELEAACTSGIREGLASTRSVQLAADEAVAAGDHATPGEWHQVDVARIAGLEPDGGAGRNVEPLAVGGEPLESKRPVRLGEVVVRSHLDRPVAGVHDPDPGHGAPGVELDVADRVDVSADRPRAAHGIGSWQEMSFVPSG